MSKIKNGRNEIKENREDWYVKRYDLGQISKVDGYETA